MVEKVGLVKRHQVWESMQYKYTMDLMFECNITIMFPGSDCTVLNLATFELEIILLIWTLLCGLQPTITPAGIRCQTQCGLCSFWTTVQFIKLSELELVSYNCPILQLFHCLGETFALYGPRHACSSIFSDIS